MDEVFKALDDPSRRLLLDALFERDGQNLGELVELLPQMTRYGVMNHLRVLEEAGLVTTRKQGRHKLHYLNPVPIRQVHDRWIAKFRAPQVEALTRLKADLEGGTAVEDQAPTHITQIIINVEPKLVWNAIIDGDVTQQYFYGTRVESDWEEGSRVVYTMPDGSLASEGEILAIEHGSFVDMTFQALWDEKLVAEGPAREIWRVEPFGGGAACKLVIELYDAPEGSATYDDFTNGFPYIVSGLKTLLETGQTLPSPY